MYDQVLLTVLHEQERRLSECEYSDLLLVPRVTRSHCPPSQVSGPPTCLKRLPEQITVPQLSMGLPMGFTVPGEDPLYPNHKMCVWQVRLPLVELLVTRSHTLHLQLVSTASALSSFLDTLQTLADTASNSKGILTVMRIAYF